MVDRKQNSLKELSFNLKIKTKLGLTSKHTLKKKKKKLGTKIEFCMKGPFP